MVAVGQTIPQFSLEDENGFTYSSENLLGRQFILYFYPKDDTPGCTVEACSFKDAYDKFQVLGVPVIGIGKGDAYSHKRFKQKFNLPFILLIDPGLAVSRAFGILQEKSMFGRKYDSILRTTFLINEEGKVVKVWEDVNPVGHAGDILSSLEK